VKVTLAVPDYFVPVINHFFDGQLERIVNMTEVWSDISLKKREWYQTKTEFFSPMHVHLIDHAFSYLCDTMEMPIEEKNYLQFDTERLPDVSQFSLPSSYITISCGSTAIVRALPASAINGISDWAKTRGLTVVYLGNKRTVRGGVAESIDAVYSDELVTEGHVDLRDKTSLLETAKVIAGAKAMVGLDGGLLHLAGCTSVPIVAAYTNLIPRHRLPIRNNELGWNCKVVTPPGCLACESNTNFLPQHDYRFCVWPELKCNEKLTADLFIQELEKIL
jgi:ADP-heptose:LPS heptosyltransferase